MLFQTSDNAKVIIHNINTVELYEHCGCNYPNNNGSEVLKRISLIISNPCTDTWSCSKIMHNLPNSFESVLSEIGAQDHRLEAVLCVSGNKGIVLFIHALVQLLQRIK